jgi:poly [ADP-ribose] polymerase
MLPNSNDSSWTAIWGRVGASENTKVYNESQFNSKYNEKLKKGYKDITDLKKEVVTTKFIDAVDKEINSFINVLQRFSKQSVTDNYSISAEAVTQAQIDRAQSVIKQISELLKVKTFNKSMINNLLIELYTVIPRKMKNVRHHIVDDTTSVTSANSIIEREQALVDNMSTQVAVSHGANSATLEDTLGIKLDKVTDEEVENIKKLLGPEAKRFVKAFKVTNHKTEEEYKERKGIGKVRWLFHGSRNENWLSILSKGLLIRPACAVLTGQMFGVGCYFANKSLKSIGYTSLKNSYWAKGDQTVGYISLYEVYTGNELHVKRHESWMYNLNLNTLKNKGLYDSLFAEKGIDLKNDEIIIYSTNQCTVRYIIEIRN